MELTRAARAVAGALYLGVSGLVASVVAAALIGDLTGATTVAARQVTSAAGLGVGTGAVAYFFVRWTGRGRSFVDASLPDRRDLAVALAGGAGLVVVVVGLDALYGALGVETATHGVAAEMEDGGRAVLIAAVVTSLALVGPGEELLYRNVVQKWLYDPFGRAGAVVVASAVFAAMHVPAYLAGDATAAAVAATLAVVFALALVLGTTFAVSENLVVPAALHGLYNAWAFASVVLG